MKRDIAYYGHPALRKKALEISEINDEVKELVQDLIDTLNEHPGWGLAAPQIGVSSRVFVTNIPDDVESEEKQPPVLKVWINPKITILGDDYWTHGEACLSIPGIYEEVERPFKLIIEALDQNGNPVKEEVSGWHARLYCHENDHLNGVLCIDRIDPKRRRVIEPELRAIKKKHPHKKS